MLKKDFRLSNCVQISEYKSLLLKLQCSILPACTCADTGYHASRDMRGWRIAVDLQKRHNNLNDKVAV